MSGDVSAVCVMAGSVSVCVVCVRYRCVMAGGEVCVCDQCVMAGGEVCVCVCVCV